MKGIVALTRAGVKLTFHNSSTERDTTLSANLWRIKLWLDIRKEDERSMNIERKDNLPEIGLD